MINAVPPTSEAITSRSESSSVPMADNGGNLTAFEQKAALFQQCDDVADACRSGPSNARDEQQLLSGYSFVNVTAVEALIAPLLCTMCNEQSLTLKETGTGTSLQFVVACGGRGDIVRPTDSPVFGSGR